MVGRICSGLGGDCQMGAVRSGSLIGLIAQWTWSPPRPLAPPLPAAMSGLAKGGRWRGWERSEVRVVSCGLVGQRRGLCGVWR
jgi:hypothetical protein